MKFVAKPYQIEATNRILNQDSVGLFLEMGLGKTASTLNAIDELVNNRFEINKVLIIAPLRVARHTWSDELGKWDHLSHMKLTKVLGTATQRKNALLEDNKVFIINRENVPWLVKHMGKRWTFDMVVIDELSSFKNKQTKRWKALRHVRSAIKKMVGLTGTPVANGLLNLWAQMWLLDQGQSLGRSYSIYRDTYFDPDQRNARVIFNWKPKPTALPEITRKISNTCVSMKKEDWITLPDMVMNRVNVELDNGAWSIYEQFEKERLVPFMTGGDVEAESAAGVTTKLLQMTGGAAYSDDKSFQIIHAHKLDALEEIAEFNEGKPILCYYGYQHELTRLQNRFPQGTRLQTDEDIEKWNRGEIPIMFCHPASAGHGLNLQHGGSIIVWFTLTYSLELYQQCNARLHRTGQEDRVIVHHLMVRDSIDESVLDALEKKDFTQEALLAALKHRVKKRKQRSLDLNIA